MVRERYHRQGFSLGGERYQPIARPDVEPDTLLEEKPEIKKLKKIKKISKKFKPSGSVAVITPWK